MPTLRVVRSKKNAEKAIVDLYRRTEVDSNLSVGVIGDNPDNDTEAFRLVTNAYEKKIKNNVLITQIAFEEGTDIEDARQQAQDVLDALANKFQTISGFSGSKDDGYMVTFVTNPVSYIDGSCFHDNNAKYRELDKVNSSTEWDLRVSKEVFFNNSDLKSAWKVIINMFDKVEIKICRKNLNK